MYRALLVSILIIIATGTLAQVYPDSNATWCLYRNVSPNGEHFTIRMPQNPDTLINNVLYKKAYDQSVANAAWGFTDQVYYIRSTQDGKGFAFLPDSSAEYLTIDLAAAVGDTVQNVLVWDEIDDCLSFGFYSLVSVVVDSIVPITIGPFQYTRHYLSSTCFPSGSFSPQLFFWQNGAGTSQGPLLAITHGLSSVELQCAVSNGVVLHSKWGGPCVCDQLNSIEGDISNLDPKVIPFESPGQFRIIHNKELEIEIYSITGSLVYRDFGLGFDISAQPPGIYIVRLRSKGFVWSGKVVR